MHTQITLQLCNFCTFFFPEMSDIDTIEIRSDEDAEGSSITARRSYNYKASVVVKLYNYDFLKRINLQ